MIESPFFQLTVELIVGFFALFAVTKFVRKTQINEITPFDFISSIVLGELLGNAIYDNDVKIWSVIYALFLWGTLMIVIEKITQRYRKTRKFLEGDPAIIIRDGQIDFEVIKKEKIDINELLSILRQKDAFSIREIEFAILEQSGSISVLKKSKYDTPTTEDLRLTHKSVYIPVTLVLDGEIIYDNLKAVGLDEKWLVSQVKMLGTKDIKNVFYADWKQDEGIHVVPRNRNTS